MSLPVWLPDPMFILVGLCAWSHGGLNTGGGGLPTGGLPFRGGGEGSAYREGGRVDLPYQPERRNAFLLGCTSFVISRPNLGCSDWMYYEPIMQVVDQSDHFFYQ